MCSVWCRLWCRVCLVVVDFFPVQSTLQGGHLFVQHHHGVLVSDFPLLQFSFGFFRGFQFGQQRRHDLEKNTGKQKHPVSL